MINITHGNNEIPETTCYVCIVFIILYRIDVAPPNSTIYSPDWKDMETSRLFTVCCWVYAVLKQVTDNHCRFSKGHATEIFCLSWLNTVLAVCEYMSFVNSWHILMKDFDWQVKFDVFVVSWQHERLNTTLKFHFCSVYIKFTH